MGLVSRLPPLMLLPLLLATCRASLLVADSHDGRLRVVELHGAGPTCTLYGDRRAAEHRLSTVDPRRVSNSSPEQFDALVRACHEHHRNHLGGGGGGGGGPLGPSPGGLRQTGFIYPGTKWCGPGSTAQHYEDLGYHEAEDACCREHDHCPAILEAGQCAQGLCNNAIYTKSHCDCDARFRRCLRSVGSETSNLIGSIFFNVVQVSCFKEKRPCYSEDVDDRSGRCRMRFHAQARYEEFGGAGGYASGPSGLVSNLLSSILPFRRR
ncbi:phospholipase A2 hemilipin-like [Frankliniella occidentalis]|uniref:Phospholipase A2 n=1 Tax=Frankliniella occidentalis TaxID=133901 RepID=A0A6J1RT39_FRAOC|nr:phospholipase A2 hemilipin-like [Frankliniella occidentalis]